MTKSRNSKSAKHTFRLAPTNRSSQSSAHTKPKPKTKTPKSHDGIFSGLSLAQKIILAVIALVVLAVAIATIFALNYTTKYQAEARISELARAYYEEYYYPNAFGGDQQKASDFLSRFSETGLAQVTLRQMLISSPNTTDHDRDFLLKYCDQNTTDVIFFPESPYAADSYHADFVYSCNFE